MKNVFLALLSALIVFSQVIQYRGSGTRAVPVLYWVTDAYKFRQEQCDRFNQWARETKQVPFELRTDPANMSLQKIILQGVTGTAGDIIQVFSFQIRYLDEIGLLEDLTPWVKELGIDTNNLYAGYIWMINQGRVVALPANSGAGGPLCVNKAVFEKYGVPLPPARWSFEEFEQIGKVFVDRANADHPRFRRFFSRGVNSDVMRNSVGVSVFNETMTRPTLNDPRYVAVLNRIRKWTWEDRIIPTQADLDSLSTEGDNFGGASALLHRGYFGMMGIGRWHFATTRAISSDVPYTCVAHPDGGFLNTQAGGKFNAVYKGSKHKDLAKVFFKWLASDDYNKKIIEDSDGEPPNMAFFSSEAYLRPAKHTNEWDYNRELSRLILTTAVPEQTTPFANFGIYAPKLGKVQQAFQSRLITAEEMVAQQEGILKDAIEDYLRRHPEMKPVYQQALARQDRIDQFKREGKPLPLSLVENPFLKIYYQKTGKAVVDGGPSAPPNFRSLKSGQ